MEEGIRVGMVLSESEAESRLLLLRRQRETIEREIHDLTLYLELGRRLRSETDEPAADGSDGVASQGARPGGATSRDDGLPDPPAAQSRAAEPGHGTEPVRPAVTMAEATRNLRAALEAQAAETAPASPRTDASPGPRAASPAPRGIQPVLSEGAQARLYGRALIAQTLAILEQARRPLHAGEILAALEARGFSVPGHDPVAALNTRLWKRAGPDGVLRRLGDAVYALPETRADEA